MLLCHSTMTPFITIHQYSASYPVYVGENLLDEIGEAITARGRVFVITSTALRERFGDRVAASFEPVADVIALEEGPSRNPLWTANEIRTILIGLGAMCVSVAF